MNIQIGFHTYSATQKQGKLHRRQGSWSGEHALLINMCVDAASYMHFKSRWQTLAHSSAARYSASLPAYENNLQLPAQGMAEDIKRAVMMSVWDCALQPCFTTRSVCMNTKMAQSRCAGAETKAAHVQQQETDKGLSWLSGLIEMLYCSPSYCSRWDGFIYKMIDG